MPRSIALLDERRIILKMLLDIMRVYCTAYFANRKFGSRHFGTCANDLLLCAAVLVGQSEGRPLNASKLAGFAGIPRPTVIRKMAALEKDGIVQRNGASFTLRKEFMNGPDALAATRFAAQQIVKAGARLSKLDTKAVATPPSIAIFIHQMIRDERLEIGVNTALLLTGLHGQ